jgi:hypothetical protein
LNLKDKTKDRFSNKLANFNKLLTTPDT